MVNLKLSYRYLMFPLTDWQFSFLKFLKGDRSGINTHAYWIHFGETDSQIIIVKYIGPAKEYLDSDIFDLNICGKVSDALRFRISKPSE